MRNLFSFTKGRYKIIFFVLIIICLILMALRFNRNGYDNDESSQSTGNIGLTEILRMFCSMLIILALIICSVFLIKKLPFLGQFANKTKQPISIISNMSLGNKRSICILRIADEILVVGITNNNISLLSKIKAEDYYIPKNTESYK